MIETNMLSVRRTVAPADAVHEFSVTEGPAFGRAN